MVLFLYVKGINNKYSVSHMTNIISAEENREKFRAKAEDSFWLKSSNCETSWFFVINGLVSLHSLKEI